MEDTESTEEKAVLSLMGFPCFNRDSFFIFLFFENSFYAAFSGFL